MDVQGITMPPLREYVNDTLERLNEKDRTREELLGLSRGVVRASSSVIKSIHRGMPHDRSMTLFSSARGSMMEIRELLETHPEMSDIGAVVTAGQELAEAGILLGLIGASSMPSPGELGIGGSSYILGLGDCIGELRRMCLDRLRAGDIDGSEELLGIMEELFDIIMEVDLPHAIIPLRPKQDAARRTLERTRGDVTFAITAKRYSVQGPGL